MLVILRNKGPIFDWFQGWDTLFIFDNILFTQFIVKHVNRAGEWVKSRNTCIVDNRRTDKNGIPERPHIAEVVDLLEKSLQTLIISGKGKYKIPPASGFSHLKGLEFEDKGHSKLPKPIGEIFNFEFDVGLIKEESFDKVILCLRTYNGIYKEKMKKVLAGEDLKVAEERLERELKEAIEKVKEEDRATTAIKNKILRKIEDLKTTIQTYEGMLASGTKIKIAAINESIEGAKEDLDLEEKKLRILNYNCIYRCDHITPIR